MYDPDAQPQPTLKYVGHSQLKADDSSSLLASEAVRLAGLPPGTLLDLYEQVPDLYSVHFCKYSKVFFRLVDWDINMRMGAWGSVLYVCII